MAGTKTHDYHILPPDIVPLATTIGALTFTTGMVLYMHDMAGGAFVPWLATRRTRQPPGTPERTGTSPRTHVTAGATRAL